MININHLQTFVCNINKMSTEHPTYQIAFGNPTYEMCDASGDAPETPDLPHKHNRAHFPIPSTSETVTAFERKLYRYFV